MPAGPFFPQKNKVLTSPLPGGGLYRLLGRKWWKGCQILMSRNSSADPADPDYHDYPAEVVSFWWPRNLPSTRAGGQDDVSWEQTPSNQPIIGWPAPLLIRAPPMPPTPYKKYRNLRENLISEIVEHVSIFLVKYGIPEVREVSRNLPGARGFTVIEYGPRIFSLDPIQPIFC